MVSSANLLCKCTTHLKEKKRQKKAIAPLLAVCLLREILHHTRASGFMRDHKLDLVGQVELMAVAPDPS